MIPNKETADITISTEAIDHHSILMPSEEQMNQLLRSFLMLDNLTEWDDEGKDVPRLVRISRGCGILVVTDGFCLGFSIKFQTTCIQQKSLRIVKHRYTSNTQVREIG